MAFLSDLMEALTSLAFPWMFMWISLKHIPQTVYQIFATRDFGTLFWPSEFSEANFGNFWATVGPTVKENAQERVVPLLEGRVKYGSIHDEVVNVPVQGTVLEVGAGSGQWMDIFAKITTSAGGPSSGTRRRTRQSMGGNAASSAKASGISKIYGVEPNPQSAAALRKRVQEFSMDEVYEVVPVGIEDIGDPDEWDGKLEPGSVDCIVTVMCLCSIPEPKKNIKLLYDLLKPGGHWYVYEHVRVNGWSLLRIYQWLVNWPWSFFLGSCRLCRPTGKTLLEVGPWTKVDLTAPADQPSIQVLPHVIGVLTK